MKLRMIAACEDEWEDCDRLCAMTGDGGVPASAAVFETRGNH